MRRTRLRAALLLAVTSALAGIGFLVFRSVTARTGRGLEELGNEVLPQVAQRIQNFRRVKVKGGRTVWEITAKDARYFERDNQVVVLEPQMTFYLKPGERQAHVRGAEGRLTLEGGEVRALTLRGGVVVQLDDLQVETDEATYDRERDLITSPAGVTIRGRAIDVQGKGLEVHVGPQQVRLLEKVHTTLHANAARS